MPLQEFPLLQDNTRLIRFKDTLYKVKVKYQLNTFPSEDVNFNQREVHDEIEQTFRAVLYLSERNQTLKTIATPNFFITPVKTPWSFPRKCSDYAFQQNGKSLKVFDYMFEFHITNRDSVENVVQNKPHVKEGHSAEKRLDVHGKQNLNIMTGCRKALVIVTDITSDGTTRFGRTEDGQLYRVCSHNANADQAFSDHYKGKVKNKDEDNRRGSSPKKSPGNVKKSLGDNQIEDRDVEETDHKTSLRRSKRTEIPGLTANRHGQSRKHTAKTQNDRVDRENSKDKSKAVRDKFSLRACELSELKTENIQHQRLRSRNYASEESLSHCLREHTKDVNYEEQGTESESSQTEVEVIERDIVHRNDIADNRQEEIRKLRNENRSTQLTKHRKCHSINKYKGQPKNKVVLGQRLKNGRSLKSRYRRRSSRVYIESNSQSETEIENTSDDNNRKTRYKNVKDDGNSRRIRTRSSDRLLQRSRSSQNKHKADSSVECGTNQNVKVDGLTHSRRLAGRSRNSSATEDDFESDKLKDFKRKSHTDRSPDNEKAVSTKRKSETLETNETRSKSRKVRTSSQESKTSPDKSSLTSSDSDLGHGGPGKKRKVDTVETRTEDDTNSVIGSQASGRSRKVKLYASRHSPQVVGDFASRPTIEISSPLVSTVLPLKRNNTSSDIRHGQRSLPTVVSPRITRQSLHEDESRRIQMLREERPSQIYRTIMLAQGRDRHVVEQAENAETDKLRQLYEPTAPRRSPRLTGLQGEKKRRSSGLWGKIMETFVTPTKKYMFGNRK